VREAHERRAVPAVQVVDRLASVRCCVRGVGCWAAGLLGCWAVCASGVYQACRQRLARERRRRVADRQADRQQASGDV
jgi:hypothetical protein